MRGKIKYNSYIATPEKIKKDYLKLYDKIGKYPNTKYLDQHDRMLLDAIRDVHGGIYNFLKSEFKLVPENYGINRPPKFWDDEDNCRIVIDCFSHKYGSNPSIVKIAKNGFNGIIRAFQRNPEMAKRLGYGKWRELRNNKMQYTSNEKKIKDDYIEIFQELGHYPNNVELNSRNITLKNSIYEKYGSLFNFLTYELKVPPKKHGICRPNGFHKDPDNYEIVIDYFTRKLGKKPSINYMKKNGFGLNIDIIRRYSNLEKKVNLSSERPLCVNDYVKNPEKMKNSYLNLVEKIGHYPGIEELRKLNSTLANAISSDHGSLYNYLVRIGIDPEKNGLNKPHNFWKDKENCIIAIEYVTRKNGRKPTLSELEKKEGFPGIARNIRKYHELSDILEYEKPVKRVSTYNSLIKLIENDENLKNIVKKIGNDPITLADIISIKYSDRVQRKDIVKLLNEKPSLREYMGKFATGITDIRDVEELAEMTLPFDKNGRIKEILKKAAFDTVLKDLGPRPSKENIKSKLKELEVSLHSF